MKQLICIGKNYLEHAKELGDAIPQKPVIFIKPAHSCEQVKGTHIELPLDERHGPVHYECEFVFRIKDPGAQQLGQAFDAITLGLDLTKRDLQLSLKKSGHPWEISKVFYYCAIIGPWQALNQFKDIPSLGFEFLLNDKIRQTARVEEMRFDPLSCLQAAREHFPIYPGDVLFTGTPAGVDQLSVHDQAELRLNKKSIYRVLWNKSFSLKDL